ncbi:MAG: TVP38/TMEM64 family protein [Bacilli bacterium]|nr:TVP38/TMEM64 family protein [Bacilli bacterium]
MVQVTEFIETIRTTLVTAGPLLGFFLIILESFIPPLPLGVFVALNCTAFGLVFGIVLSWVATIIGCILSYTLFYSLSKNVIDKRIKGKRKERIEKACENFHKISFTGLVLLIALPFTPAFLINIIAGMTKISRRKFIASLFVGKVFTISFWGYIGKSFIDSLMDVKALIFITISLGIAYIVSKIVSKKMNIE